jgi:hypothetical protein
LPPIAALRAALDEFVEHMMKHPAYVRLALVDFATPNIASAHLAPRRAAARACISRCGGESSILGCFSKL